MAVKRIAVGLAALEYAKALVEYAEGKRVEKPAAPPGLTAAEAAAALKALGYDPRMVAEKVKERVRASPAAPPQAAAGLELRVGGSRSVFVLLPGGDAWLPLKDAVKKKVEWLSPSEGVVRVAPRDLPEGSVIRVVVWGRKMRPVEEKFYVARGGAIEEEEVAGEEDQPAGGHLGHEIRVKVAVTKSGLRIPKYWYVASGGFKAAVEPSSSLPELKRKIEKVAEELGPKQPLLPEHLKKLILSLTPEWADGAFVEKVSLSKDVARPVAPEVREKVMELLTGYVSEPPGSDAPPNPFGSILWRQVRATAAIVPGKPPSELAPKEWSWSNLVEFRSFPTGHSMVRYIPLTRLVEPLAEKLDALVPGWRDANLHVVADPFATDPKEYAGKAKKLLRLPATAPASEAIAAALKELAKWEGSVVSVAPDAAVVLHAAPVKKSKTGSGYYYGVGWKMVEVPVEAKRKEAEEWVGTVVLKDGTAYRTKAVWNVLSGGYAQLPPPPSSER